MGNLNSSLVSVFPCVSRTDDYALDSKLLSEKNLSNIIKCVTDKKSFVINDDLDNLEFVIDGYYFKLNGHTLSGTTYAYLSYQDANPTLLEGDDKDIFTGLNLTNNSSGDSGEYLQLCEYIEETNRYRVPPESKIKFVLTALDCGEVKIIK
jgi:hypothetical protein